MLSNSDRSDSSIQQIRQVILNMDPHHINRSEIRCERLTTGRQYVCAQGECCKVTHNPKTDVTLIAPLHTGVEWYEYSLGIVRIQVNNPARCTRGELISSATNSASK